MLTRVLKTVACLRECAWQKVLWRVLLQLSLPFPYLLPQSFIDRFFCAAMCQDTSIAICFLPCRRLHCRVFRQLSFFIVSYCSSSFSSSSSSCRYVLSFAMGAGPVPALLLPELFPSSIRGTGMSLALGTHWVRGVWGGWESGGLGVVEARFKI